MIVAERCASYASLSRAQRLDLGRQAVLIDRLAGEDLRCRGSPRIAGGQHRVTLRATDKHFAAALSALAAKWQREYSSLVRTS
jgi:hypothetical protein